MSNDFNYTQSEVDEITSYAVKVTQEMVDQIKADGMEEVKSKMVFFHTHMIFRYGADIVEAKADAFDELKAWLDKKTNGSSIEEDNE